MIYSYKHNSIYIEKWVGESTKSKLYLYKELLKKNKEKRTRKSKNKETNNRKNRKRNGKINLLTKKWNLQ